MMVRFLLFFLLYPRYATSHSYILSNKFSETQKYSSSIKHKHTCTMDSNQQQKIPSCLLHHHSAYVDFFIYIYIFARSSLFWVSPQFCCMCRSLKYDSLRLTRSCDNPLLFSLVPYFFCCSLCFLSALYYSGLHSVFPLFFSRFLIIIIARVCVRIYYLKKKYFFVFRVSGIYV